MAEYDDIDAPDEAHVPGQTGDLVPKGEDAVGLMADPNPPAADPPGEGDDPFDGYAEDDAPDAEPAVGSVGEAVDGTVVDDPDAPPPPVNPSSSAEAAQERVLWENQINADAEAFATHARLVYAEATAAGHSVSLVVSTPDDE